MYEGMIRMISKEGNKDTGQRTVNKTGRMTEVKELINTSNDC